LGIFEAFLHSFTVYYGIDWIALVAGVSGSYLMTNRNRLGFLMSGFACVAGLIIAAMSGQFGFIAYNIIIIGLMVRGYRLWGRSYHNGLEAAE
jgi:hypothetical protein